jgi:hypothetical protein
VRDHQKEKEKKNLEAEIRAQIAIEVILHACSPIPMPFHICGGSLTNNHPHLN